jgi:hypothetical protein
MEDLTDQPFSWDKRVAQCPAARERVPHHAHEWYENDVPGRARCSGVSGATEAGPARELPGSATAHTPASHYGHAMNTYAAWYVKHIDPDAMFSRKYRFARAMVDQALALGWIPSEAPFRFADCTCDKPGEWKP